MDFSVLASVIIWQRRWPVKKRLACVSQEQELGYQVAKNKKMYQWRSHTSGVRGVRTPCQENT